VLSICKTALATSALNNSTFSCGMSVIRGTAVADTDSIISVQASTTYSAEPSENPLDVLSRAATMVEKSSEIIGHGKVSPPPSSIKKGLSGSQSLSCIERHPSFKERTHPKFRKSATPDYMVALDVARGLKRQTSIQSDQSENNMDTSLPNNNSLQPHEDLPLDMSIKKRPTTPPALPPPPPYRTPTHFMYKSPPPYPATPSPPTSHVPPTSSLPPLPPPPTYEDSTIKCTYPTINMQQQPPPPTSILPPPNLHQEPEEKTKIKEITIITNASSDPLLDEHFRRSLGADYESLFKKKTSTGGDSESSSPSSSTNSSITESTPPKVPDQLVVSTNISHQTKLLNRSDTKTPTESANCSSNLQDNNKEDSTQVDDPVKAFQEDLEMEGYTVEDHFAKALGDTWIKLQKAEEEKRSKNKSEEKPTLVVSS